MRKFQRKIKVKMSEEFRAMLHYCLVDLLNPEIHNYIDEKVDATMMASVWMDIEKKLNKSIGQRKKQHRITLKYHEASSLIFLFNGISYVIEKLNLAHEQSIIIAEIDQQLK